MTGERSCETCRFSSINNDTGKSCWSRGIFGCISYSKWQPISKPKIQMTEEEFIQMMSDLGWTDVTAGNYVIKTAKQKGYIRKSELVELVEEAEWIYENYQSAKHCLTTDEALEKNYQALQALKKDHPEFGGKK